MHRLLLMIVLPSVAVLVGQNKGVTLLGIEFHLGESRDLALSRFADRSDLKLAKLDNDSYVVLKRISEKWESAGNLSFMNGKLSRIAVNICESEEKPSQTIAKAAYSAIAGGEQAGFVELWTGTNNDALHPFYEVHLVFKDREVVIASYTATDIDAASVKVYFPRLRTAAPKK